MSEHARIQQRLEQALADRQPVVVATVVAGEPLGAKMLVTGNETLGGIGDPALTIDIEATARQLLTAEQAETVTFETGNGPLDIFFDVHPAPPVLLVFGAVHAAQPLATFAKTLGYDVIVTDARAKLATPERFPNVDRLLVAWPDEALAQLDVQSNWYVAILTHDPKFDEPALIGCLATPARYIGAIGSRKTNADRRRRLTEAGVSPEDLERVRGPIGLDIGAATPEEMAISILGEIIAYRHGRMGGLLTSASGSIRGTAAVAS